MECITCLTFGEIMRRTVDVDGDRRILVEEIRLRTNLAANFLSAFGQALSVTWQSQAACQKKIEPVAFKLACRISFSGVQSAHPAMLAPEKRAFASSPSPSANL